MHSSYKDLLSSSHLKKRVLHCLHFPIPSSFFDYNNNGASNGTARCTPKATNLRNISRGREGGREGREGVRTLNIKQFGGDDLLTRHNH